MATEHISNEEATSSLRENPVVHDLEWSKFAGRVNINRLFLPSRTV